MKHLLRHIGFVAAGVLLLTSVGVSWQTALYLGLAAGCVLMAFGGHGGHAADTDAPTATSETEPHRH